MHCESSLTTSIDTNLNLEKNRKKQKTIVKLCTLCRRVFAKFPYSFDNCERSLWSRHSAGGFPYASDGAVEGVVFLDDVLEVWVHPKLKWGKRIGSEKLTVATVFVLHCSLTIKSLKRKKKKGPNHSWHTATWVSAYFPSFDIFSEVRRCLQMVPDWCVWFYGCNGDITISRPPLYIMHYNVFWVLGVQLFQCLTTWKHGWKCT